MEVKYIHRQDYQIKSSNRIVIMIDKVMLENECLHNTKDVSYISYDKDTFKTG